MTDIMTQLQTLYSGASKYSSAIVAYDEQRRLSWPSYVVSVKGLTEAFNLSPEEPVVELGCACGNFVAALRDLGFTNARGSDVSEAFVQTAVSWGRDYITVASAEDTPMGTGVVCAFDILEHLPGGVLERTLLQCNATARLLLFSVPVLDIFEDQLPDGVVRSEYAAGDELYEHYVNFHREGWEKLFAQHLLNFVPHPLSGKQHYFSSKAPLEFFAYQRKESL